MDFLDQTHDFYFFWGAQLIAFWDGKQAKEGEVKGDNSRSSRHWSEKTIPIEKKIVVQSEAALAAKSSFPHIIINFMNPFNYFVVPASSFPSLYYLPLASATSLDPPVIQSNSQMPSSNNLRSSAPTSSTLELTREDLMEAGYEKKKRVWSA